ncbi:MAG: hypothetical protein S4CHLAM102_08310 [Chlamydiia bacterium]|nr:hypothetical protein [Chlamydiia bacterium]
MSKSTNEQRLFSVATLQQGYFTSKQAKEAGYSDSNFSTFVHSGKWIHEGRGIYRLANYPPTERPDLVYWSLWSCNRLGEVQGVFSHQTALAIHDLSDVMPSRYHLSVPKGFRKYHPPPPNLILHYNTLVPEDVIEYEGYRVTTPLRTIHDVLVDEATPEEFAEQAVSDGLERGIINKRSVWALAEEADTERTERIINNIDPTFA